MATLRENVKPDPCPEYCCTKFSKENDLFMLNRNFSVVMTANKFKNFVTYHLSQCLLYHPKQLLPVLLQQEGEQDEKRKKKKTDGDRGCNDDRLVQRSRVDHLRL